MTTRLGSLILPNPVLTASGCAAAGRELSQFFDVSELGAVVTKSIQLRARSGRPTPRMAETPSGMLNSIGLQGPGIDAFIDNDLAWLRRRGVRTVVSIAGSSGSHNAFSRMIRMMPSAARRSAYGSPAPVGRSPMAKNPTSRSSLSASATAIETSAVGTPSVGPLGA